MNWWWRRRREANGHENLKAAAARRAAEARLSAEQRTTRIMEKLADQMAELSPEEFAERVTQAFMRRST